MGRTLKGTVPRTRSDLAKDYLTCAGLMLLALPERIFFTINVYVTLNNIVNGCGRMVFIKQSGLAKDQ